MKAAAYVLLLLSVLALSAPGFAQATDYIIVAGQRIGMWTLEMSLDDLSNLNGPGVTGRATDLDMRPGFSTRVWPALGLVAGYREGQTKVAWFYLGIMTDGPTVGGLTNFHTDRNISVMSCKDQVLREYGRPTWERVAFSGQRSYHLWRLVYARLGIAFLNAPDLEGFCENREGVVLGLNVFQPETANSIWR